MVYFLRMTLCALGSQPGARKNFTAKGFIDPQAQSYFLGGSVDVASVNKSCYPVHLLSWFSILRTENVRPES